MPATQTRHIEVLLPSGGADNTVTAAVAAAVAVAPTPSNLLSAIKRSITIQLSR